LTETTFSFQYIDYTYVRAQSPTLEATLRQEVAAFSNDLRRGPASGLTGDGGVRAGQVSLEFYQKKRRWPFAPENIPWEVCSILYYLL
jgi:hypothetical protein